MKQEPVCTQSEQKACRLFPLSNLNAFDLEDWKGGNADVGPHWWLVRPLVRHQKQQQKPAGSRKAAAWSSTAAAAVNHQQGQIAPHPSPAVSLNHLQSTTPLCPPTLDESLPWRDVPWSPLRVTRCLLLLVTTGPLWPPTSWQLVEERRLHPRPARASRGRTTPASSSYFLPQHFSPH